MTLPLSSLAAGLNTPQTFGPWDPNKDSGRTQSPAAQAARMKAVWGPDYANGNYKAGKTMGDGWRLIQPGNNQYYALYPDGSFYPIANVNGQSVSLKQILAADPNAQRTGPTSWSFNLNGKPVTATQGKVDTGQSGTFNNMGSTLAGLALGGGVGGLAGATAAGNAVTGKPVTEGVGKAGVLDAAGLALAPFAAAGTAALGGATAAPGAASVAPGGAGEFAGAYGDLGTAGGAVDAANTAALEGGAAGAGGATAAGGGGAGGGLSLANIANAGTLGTIAGTALGVLGSNQQKNDLNNIATGIRADRAPYLDASKQWLSDPNAYFSGPGAASMQGVLRALSVNGNPAGNATSQEIATEAGLRNWQNAVLGFGNVGLGGQGIEASAATNAAGAGADTYNAIGSGIANLTNPSKSLSDIWKQIQAMGYTGAAA